MASLDCASSVRPSGQTAQALRPRPPHLKRPCGKAIAIMGFGIALARFLNFEVIAENSSLLKYTRKVHVGVRSGATGTKPSSYSCRLARHPDAARPKPASYTCLFMGCWGGVNSQTQQIQNCALVSLDINACPKPLFPHPQISHSTRRLRGPRSSSTSNLSTFSKSMSVGGNGTGPLQKSSPKRTGDISLQTYAIVQLADQTSSSPTT